MSKAIHVSNHEFYGKNSVQWPQSKLAHYFVEFSLLKVFFIFEVAGMQMDMQISQFYWHCKFSRITILKYSKKYPRIIAEIKSI